MIGTTPVPAGGTVRTLSATAWADAATRARSTPVRASEKDLDRWNGDGGSDPD